MYFVDNYLVNGVQLLRKLPVCFFCR